MQQATTPGKPTVTSQTERSATSVEVAFTLDEDGGSPVTSYGLRCESTDGGAYADPVRNFQPSHPYRTHHR